MPPVGLPRGGARPAPPRVIVQAPTLPPIITARAPASTRQQVAYVPPARPVYVPPAPPSTRTGYNPRGVAITPAPRPTVNDLHTAAVAAAPFHDAGPTGDYGTKAVNAYKQTPAYKQAVVETFLHQSPYQRQAIVTGALHNSAAPESKMILDYVKRTGGGPGGGSNLVPAAVYGGVVRASLPAPTGIEKILQAGVKDIVNYAPQTLQGIWSGLSQEGQVARALMGGDPAGALQHTETELHQQFDPFVQAAEHPIATFKAHPVNTLLMALGAKAALFKGAGAVMRSGAVGPAAEAYASTARAPLSLGTVSGQPTGGPLVEYRGYSKDILNKRVQVAREKYIRKVLGQDPNVARPAPRAMPQSMQDAFNVGQEAKLRRVGNEMASVQQTLQRAERGRMVQEANTAKPKLKAARNVVTHILQGVVRPNTAALPNRAAEDFASEAQRLKDARTEARSQSNLWNKQQVRDIEQMLKTPGALEQALAAAEHLRPVINGQDVVLDHHAILTPEQLTAKYFPYAQKHMGAIYDHQSGQLIVPATPVHTVTDLRAAEATHQQALASEQVVRRGGPTVAPHRYAPAAVEINGKTWYHGTNVKTLTAEKLDSSGTNEANLFGQGVYLTDNPEVAKGYAEARARRRGTPSVYSARIQIRNPLNLEAPVNPKFAGVLASRLENLAGMGDTQAAVDLRQFAKKPGVTNEQLYRQFVEHVANFAADEQIPRSELVEDFQIIASELRSEGFDALTHVGGKRVGARQGGPLHQVVILLDPSNTGALAGAGRQAVEFTPHVDLHAANLAKATQATANAKAEAERIRASLSASPLYKSLSTDEIRAHLDANGVPDPAYVGHYANKATPRQFYMRYVKSRGTLSQGTRTGEAFRKGGYDHTYDGLTGQMAARAQAVAKAGIHDRLVQRSYLKPKDVVANQVKQEWAKARAAIRKDPARRAEIEARTRKETASIRTGMYTPAEAKAVLHAQPRDDYGNLMPGEIEMQPVAASSQKTIEMVRDLQNPMQLQGVSDLEAQALKRAIDEAKGRTDGVRNIVLAPKVLTDQLTEQFAPGGRVERGIGRWTQQFRNTVLPYSTHWMAQIGTEAVLRSILAGIWSPHYIADAKALYDRLGKTEAGRAAAAEMSGATFYGQHGTMGIYHSPNPALRTAQNLRGTSDVIAAHKWYVHQVGRLMYSFEHNARMAGLGKLMHDHAAEIREFGHGWQGALRLQGEIIDQIARGLETNPALVAKFGRKIDDLFGQYGKYSPRTRAIIQSIAPFLPWYLTATKYVFWQLPVHHPIASALLASLRQTLNQDIADGKKEPLNPYATQAFGTLSPFGIFTPESTKPADIAKELVQKGASLALPEVQGAFLALGGDDPFFGRLRGPHGEIKGLSPQAIEQAVNAGAEAVLPPLTKLRQVLEGGRPSYGTSSVINPQPKPGSGPGDLSQILNRTINPFYSLGRAMHPPPKRGRGSRGSSTGGGGDAFGPTLSPSGGGGFGPTLRP